MFGKLYIAMPLHSRTIPTPPPHHSTPPPLHHHPTPPQTTPHHTNMDELSNYLFHLNFLTRPWSGSIFGVLFAAAQSVSEHQLAKFVCLFVWWAGIRSLQTNSPVALAIAVFFLGWSEYQLRGILYQNDYGWYGNLKDNNNNISLLQLYTCLIHFCKRCVSNGSLEKGTFWESWLRGGDKFDNRGFLIHSGKMPSRFGKKCQKKRKYGWIFRSTFPFSTFFYGEVSSKSEEYFIWMTMCGM